MLQVACPHSIQLVLDRNLKGTSEPSQDAVEDQLQSIALAKIFEGELFVKKGNEILSG